MIGHILNADKGSKLPEGTIIDGAKLEDANKEWRGKAALLVKRGGENIVLMSELETYKSPKFKTEIALLHG